MSVRERFMRYWDNPVAAERDALVIICAIFFGLGFIVAMAIWK